MASEQLQVLINALRNAPALDQPTVQQQRDNFEQGSALRPLPPDVRTEPVDAGGVPAEWVTIEGNAAAPVALFLHGGGYCIGSIATHRLWAADLARAAGGRVLVIDYRLAPEHPHPAALDDAVAAYRWLLAQGVAPNTTVIHGDSAGGGLTAATLLALRDAGEPLPAAAVMVSPWLDLTCSSGSFQHNVETDCVLTQHNLSMWANMYAGEDAGAPLVSPLHGDLSGLPQLLIQVGTAELLLDDSTQFAERAKAAGVDVTLDVWDDMLHIWPIFAWMLPEGQQAIDRAAAYIKERVAVHA
jgi:acetyl esterase/lipase